MTEKIKKLAALSNKEDIIPPDIKIEFDPLDMALPEPIMNAKRITEFINAKTVYITEDNLYTGMMRPHINGVPGDIFSRCGHDWFNKACGAFYNKYTENLVVFEWQHSAPNYEYILKNGIKGSLEKIERAKKKYRFEKEKFQFLEGMEIICSGVISWANKCADVHEAAAKDCADPDRKAELLELARICRNVPENSAKSFYEGLQSVLFCFYCLPDSIGTLDRYMYDLYIKDIESGKITREQAKHLLQEFFIHLSAFTKAGTNNGHKSAECHFAIGGYNEKGEDSFNDLSRLIVEALMELDTRRPAISLRWTKKTPFETLKFMFDCERNDPHKRIAFVSDEPRIKALTEIVGLPYSEAVKYTMVGCNEPSFPGTLWLGGNTVNIARCLTNTLYNRTADIVNAKDFEEFYAVFVEELNKDIDRILYYDEKFNAIRYKDCSMLSNFLLDGCIENATPANRYGCKNAIGGFDAMGLTCVIDSLTVIKQFVFDEKRTTLSHLIEVMQSNWEKDGALHAEILNTAKFFGNNEELSDAMARRFTTELYEATKDKRLPNGAKILIGNLAGYNPHHVKFGNLTPATPDGRMDGEGFMVGSGQARGKDRKGLLALMKSVAQMDPTGIMNGPVVCNMLIDEKLIRDDEYFEKLCRMFEQYFKMGGLHVQLNYVSKEELLAAKACPEEHKSLKVRVSGFSAPFVILGDDIQGEIINRTTNS